MKTMAAKNSFVQFLQTTLSRFIFMQFLHIALNGFWRLQAAIMPIKNNRPAL